MYKYTFIDLVSFVAETFKTMESEGGHITILRKRL